MADRPASDAIPSGSPPAGAFDHDALAGYVRDLFAQEDDLLRSVRRRADDAGLPRIQVPPNTARVVHLLIRAIGARKVLEVGTLAGYSAVWIGRALPVDGELVSLEIDPHHAEIARACIRDAGLSDRVDIRVGEAVRTMAELGPDGSFDAVFLDADKERYPIYLEESARLLRTGGLILADNAFWRGEVVAPEPDSVAAQLDRFNRFLASDGRFEGTILPVGDGLAVGIRR